MKKVVTVVAVAGLILLTIVFLRKPPEIEPEPAPAQPKPSVEAPAAQDDARASEQLAEATPDEQAAPPAKRKRRVSRAELERLKAERLERERLAAERREQERLEAERLEQERLEAERLEAERQEQERLAAERREQERLEAERLERERLKAARLEIERQRLEKERLERELAERRLLKKLRIGAGVSFNKDHVDMGAAFVFLINKNVQIVPQVSYRIGKYHYDYYGLDVGSRFSGVSAPLLLQLSTDYRRNTVLFAEGGARFDWLKDRNDYTVFNSAFMVGGGVAFWRCVHVDIVKFSVGTAYLSVATGLRVVF